MLSLIAALMLAGADPAPAAQATDAAAAPPAAAAAPAAKPKKKQPDPNERVCWSEKTTDSHLPKEVCATRMEKDLMERQGQDALRRNERSVPTGLRPG